MAAEDGGAHGGAQHAYRSFIKSNFASVKSSQPPGEREAVHDALFLSEGSKSLLFHSASPHSAAPSSPAGTPHSAIMKALSAQWSTVKRVAQQQQHQHLAPHREEDQQGRGDGKAPISLHGVGSQPEGSPGARAGDGSSSPQGTSVPPSGLAAPEDHALVQSPPLLSPRRRLSMASALDSPGATDIADALDVDRSVERQIDNGVLMVTIQGR